MSSVIMESKTMEGQPPIDQARRALTHMLGRIKHDPSLAYLTGVGTDAWSKLTEALASIDGLDVRVVRTSYLPPRSENPNSERSRQRQRDDDERLGPVPDLISIISICAQLVRMRVSGAAHELALNAPARLIAVAKDPDEREQMKELASEIRRLAANYGVHVA